MHNVLIILILVDIYKLLYTRLQNVLLALYVCTFKYKNSQLVL